MISVATHRCAKQFINIAANMPYGKALKIGLDPIVNLEITSREILVVVFHLLVNTFWRSFFFRAIPKRATSLADKK